MSMAELRAFAAAAADEYGMLDPTSGVGGGGGGRGGGGQQQLVATVSGQEELLQQQREELRDCTLGIIENLMVIASENPVGSGATSLRRERSIIRLCSPLAHYCQKASDLLSFWR